MSESVPPAPPAVRALQLELERLSPRSRQLLLRLLAEGESLDQAATFFGIPPAALNVMLYRAVREAANLPTAPSSLDEGAAAARLSQAWRADRLPTDAEELARAAPLLDALRLHGRALLDHLDAAERAFERSSAGTRDRILRRLLVVAVIAVALYLFARQPA